MNTVDLSFFENTKVFTYAKVSHDMLPCSIDTVKDLYPHKPNFDKFSHYKLPEDRLDGQFLKLLRLAGLAVKHAEIFYRPGTGQNMDAFIHTDGHQVVPGFAKINYIMGGSNNLMKWWRPKAVTEKNNMTTPIGTKYLKFSEEECIELDQVDMRGLYVVNAGIPHSVSMSSGTIENPRICISVTPLSLDTMKNVGCHTAINRIEHALKHI
jgi:hypothetical protein